ncbi:MAG: histidine kinase [Bacteroidota bacterium]
MYLRLARHIGFWLGYLFLYAFLQVLFAGPSDQGFPIWWQFLRFSFAEGMALPWKIIPFYLIFYRLIPQYLPQRKWWPLAGYSLIVILGCILGYRLMIQPTQWLLYRETPSYEVFSLNRLFYTFTEIVPAIGIAGTAKLLSGRIRHQQRERQLEFEKTRNELRFLKAQTHPHFLFNTLNNLYGLARRKDEHTADAILQLSQIMRFILHECEQDEIPLHKELTIIEAFIELERLRFHDRLGIQTHFDVEDANWRIAPLVLLPFVENAFKHVAASLNTAAFVDIRLRVRSGQLQFRVSNSKSPDDLAGSQGIGLAYVQRQLDLIYSERADLDILVRPDQFIIQLDIHQAS